MLKLLARMKKTKSKTEYMKLQAMYLYKIAKMKAKDVAKHVGTTKEMVYQWSHTYKKYGIRGFINKPKGGRTWAFLSLTEEQDLLKEVFIDNANQALGTLSKIVRKKAEEKLGRPVSADYAEDLLNKHRSHKFMSKHKTVRKVIHD